LRHKYPILRRNLFLNGQYIEELGVRDVTWIGMSGEQMSEEDWQAPSLHCFGTLLDGRAQTSGIKRPGREATILIVVNGRESPMEFTLPECTGNCRWSLLVDTQEEEPAECAMFDVGTRYPVAGRSLLVFARESEANESGSDPSGRDTYEAKSDLPSPI
jgi:isoamylase